MIVGVIHQMINFSILVTVSTDIQLTYRRTIRNDFKGSKRQEFTLRNKVQHNFGQSDDLICVSLITCTL